MPPVTVGPRRWERASFGCQLASTVVLACVVSGAKAQTNPMPSWNEGAARSAITEFVARTTSEGSTNFVPPAERIAVFDNDGTLWSEQPVYVQLAFAIDRIAALAPQHPKWQSTQPFKALIDKNPKALAASGEKGLLQIMAVTHAGMTTDAFAATVARWFATARHPRFARPYSDLVYQPMLELLAFLRASGFKTFIVSGGGVEFMRVWAENVYGIPPEQVVGSTGMTRFTIGPEGSTSLVKLPQIDFIDDGPGKPVAINRVIGRRPILAFGNSDGDLQMLQYVGAGSGLCLVGIVHHTDAEREWAYDRNSHIGKLDKALDEGRAKGWTIVDMKRDWNSIYPFQQTNPEPR